MCQGIVLDTHGKKTPFLISRTLEIISVMLCSQTSESHGSLIQTEVARYYPLLSDSVDRAVAGEQTFAFLKGS